MGITTDQIYWLMTVDNIILTSIIIFILLFIILFIQLAYSDFKIEFRHKILFCLLIIFLLIPTFMPSSQTLIAMHGIPALLNYQKAAIAEAGETPTKILKLINQILDEKLKEPKK